MLTQTRPRFLSRTTTGVILVMLSALGYAWLPIFAKWAYADGLRPIDLLTLRFAIAAPTMWLLTLRPDPAAGSLPRSKLLAAGALLALNSLTAFFSLALIPSSLYTLLLYSYPAIVVLLSRLNGEILSTPAAGALALTIAGVALTVPLEDAMMRTIHPAGVSLALLNAGLYAVYILYSQRVLAQQRAVAHATRWSITGSLLAMALMAILNGIDLPRTWSGWGSVVGLALVCTVLPIFTFLSGIKRLGASKASIISSIEPLATLVLAVFLLGERLNWQQTLGGALILASVVLIQIRR